MNLLAALALGLACLAAPTKPKKIVLLAGPLDSHPKDTHEYQRNIVLLKNLLDASLKDVVVETHFDGWPADPATLDDADTIFLTSGGCDHKLEDHPFYVGDRLAAIRKQMKRGCGLVLFHWSTFNPAVHHDEITEWVGGYFDYEKGPAANKWYSKIETRDWTTVVASPDHPIARGVAPFKVKEEFYFNLRFRDEDPRLKLILCKDAGDPRAGAVGWAVERADGGRGFGFTGGHFFSNWWIPEFRKLVLNAVAWSAKLEIPAGGIESTLEEPVRALILTGHNHPAHDWRTTSAALLHVLEQDPRMKVDVTENPEDLAGKRMDSVDLLVLNYNNWDKPGLSDGAKAGFLKYLERGGGLSVIHFADGAWNKTLPAKDSEWEDYRAKIVRRAWMHPDSAHDPYGPFPVERTALKHEIGDGLASFETIDELYFKQAGDLPIEPLFTAKSKVTGKDEPMAWAYDVGKARVFQTLLGHSAESIRKAGALIRRGSVWAARRTPLGFDPPLALLEKATFRNGAKWTGKAPPPPVAPADPGLDGGKGGHWGEKGEKDWADARWNQMDTGPFMSSSLALPKGAVVRAISVKLGDAAICFDTEALSVRAGWTGGFLSFSPVRYGLIEMPKIAGTLAFEEKAGPLWDVPGKFLGVHLLEESVAFEYDIDGMRVWDTSSYGKDGFRRFLQIAPHAAARTLIVDGKPILFPPADQQTEWGKGKPSDLGMRKELRWGLPIEMRGQVSRDPGPYVVDTIPVPFENRWKALMFLSGFDFFSNGDAAVCTLHGDVWRVSGIDEKLEKVTWKRVATGLFQPLGLRIVDDRVYVLGRDRITRLKIVDGEAQDYESFSTAPPASTGGHDYITCLETDAQGNFYFVGWKGLYRVSPDGKSSEMIAGGWRNPNGLSVGPDGTITVAPQEGEWTPASAITIARPGGYYGYGGPKVSAERPLGYDPPLCWIPRGIDNSTGGQAWVTSDRWGPLQGQLLSFSFGQSSMMLVLRDGAQGAVVPFKLAFASGAMRARFRPQDGQLYVVGTKGWVTNAARDGSLQRVRYTGAKVRLPVAMHAKKGGLELRFSDPLDRETAESPDSWAVEQWNYLYAAQYGSKDYSVLQPGVEGHDPVDVKAVRLSDDGLGVFLEMPALRPVMQLRVRYSLRAAAGGAVKGELDATIHRLAE